MSDTTLGDFIALITQEISGTLDEAKSQNSEQIKLNVSDVYFDIPAHLYLQNNRQSSNQDESNLRVMVSLPSTLENPNVGKLGRIRMTIALEQNSD
ncbi:MAG: hypothetical protein WA919_08715 [Coleofasciculaceae cyanobacterium]